MKKLFSVTIKALVFGIVIYFFLEEILPRIQKSELISGLKNETNYSDENSNENKSRIGTKTFTEY